MHSIQSTTSIALASRALIQTLLSTFFAGGKVGELFNFSERWLSHLEKEDNITHLFLDAIGRLHTKCSAQGLAQCEHSVNVHSHLGVLSCVPHFLSASRVSQGEFCVASFCPLFILYPRTSHFEELFCSFLQYKWLLLLRR